MNINYPPFPVRTRVIIDTDAKNEADDQFAIAQGLLSPSLDVRGIVPVHFGTRPNRSSQSMLDSKREVELMLDLLDLDGECVVRDGASMALPDFKTPVDTPGARLIIEEANRDDTSPLFVLFLGPLTDMASALLLEPSIAEKKNITVVWIGGAEYEPRSHPVYWPEFNLSNDIAAANVVFSSAIKIWQIPMNVYMSLAVSYAELLTKVEPHGQLGNYLTRQLFEWNSEHASQIEYRALGDCAAVAVTLYPNCGHFQDRQGQGFRFNGEYDGISVGGPVRIYDSIDTRFVLDDLFAKIQLAAHTNNEHPEI